VIFSTSIRCQQAAAREPWLSRRNRRPITRINPPQFIPIASSQALRLGVMKTTYILGAILACSVIGTLVGARAAKTAFLVLSGILSLYGLVRLLG
jgi:hypothetical protein